jgi:hypothetical protein
VDAEAARMPHLNVFRLYRGASGFFVVVSSMSVLMLLLQLQNASSFGWMMLCVILATSPPLVADVLDRLEHQDLRRSDPLVWVLRKLVRDVVSGHGIKAERMAGRPGMAEDWREALTRDIAPPAPQSVLSWKEKAVVGSLMLAPLLGIPILMWIAR